MSQEILASQAINNLNQALVNAFVQREDGQVKVDEANAMIKAIRNQLGGVGIGQKLQQQIDSENAETARKELEAKRKADEANKPVMGTRAIEMENHRAAGAIAQELLRPSHDAGSHNQGHDLLAR